MGTSLMFMIIDLNPSKRGLAVGIGECTIYGSTAVATFLYPEIAHLVSEKKGKGGRGKGRRGGRGEGSKGKS